MHQTWLHKKMASMSAAVPLLMGGALAVTAHAQSTQAPAAAGVEEGAGLDEILVTARRKSEDLQATPVAVTSLQPQALQDKQVVQVSDLMRGAPALSVGTGGVGPPTVVYLAIRGQAQTSPNSFSDSPVGIYLDGVYVARPLVGNLGFLDAASVEVLRGPQGTLFGRNTTGGALNITTAQPTQELEGYLKAGFGSFETKLYEGVLNVPLTDELAFRAAARHDEHDGYYKNPFIGYRQGEVRGNTLTRGTLKWTPSSLPLTWVVSGDYARYRDSGNGIAPVAFNPAGTAAAFYGISQGVRAGVLPPDTPIPLGPGFSVPASEFRNFSFGPVGRALTDYLAPGFATPAERATLFSDDPHTTHLAPRTGNPEIDEQYARIWAWSGTSNLTLDLGDVALKSITGYRKSRGHNSADLGGVPVGIGAFVSDYHNHQFSQELQIQGSRGRFNYIGGLYYFREAGDERSDVGILYDTPFANFNRVLGDYSSRSLGVFSQANYQLSDRWRTTAGIRYTWDRRYANRHGVIDYRVADPVCQIGPNAGLAASQAPCDDAAVAKFDYPAWTVGVDYAISDDLFTYLKTSGASNSGGFNVRDVPPTASKSFDPDHVVDVEAGLKGEFFERHLRTNLAVFHAWQKDAQRVVNTTFVNPSTGQQQLSQFVGNAGKVRTYGVEFEADLVPWKGMTLSASAAYLHGKYVAGSRTENQLVGAQVVQVDRSGEPLLQAPKWTAGASATQLLQFKAGELRLHADYSYVSSRYWDYFTTGDPAQVDAVAAGNEASLIRAYGLVNAAVGFTFDDPDVEIVASARNLTDKTYYTNAFNSYTGLGFTAQAIGEPRIFTLTIAYRF